MLSESFILFMACDIRFVMSSLLVMDDAIQLRTLHSISELPFSDSVPPLDLLAINRIMFSYICEQGALCHHPLFFHNLSHYHSLIITVLSISRSMPLFQMLQSHLFEEYHNRCCLILGEILDRLITDLTSGEVKSKNNRVLQAFRTTNSCYSYNNFPIYLVAKICKTCTSCLSPSLDSGDVLVAYVIERVLLSHSASKQSRVKHTLYLLLFSDC